VTTFWGDRTRANSGHLNTAALQKFIPDAYLALFDLAQALYGTFVPLRTEIRGNGRDLVPGACPWSLSLEPSYPCQQEDS